MPDVIRIKRRVSGAPGAPASLANAELAYNEIDHVLYYGEGTGGAGGTASAIVAVGGPGFYAPLASPTFTGDPRAPTPATSDNDTSIATTAFVKAQGYLASSDLSAYALLASPTFTGDPKAPTPATGDNDTSVATTAFVKAQGYEVSVDKGAANGYAALDASAKVPAAQLPSYVDDVVEYANLAAFPATGTTGLIYVALDSNKIYRWSGSVYVEISPSPGSTDAVPEGSVNLYYTDARVAANATVTSKAPLASPTFTGNPAAPTPTAGDNDTSIATTAFIQTAIAGKADTSALALKADLASPTFTGDPKAPTPATGDNDTSVATTAFVKAQGYLVSTDLANYALLASPAFTGNPTAPTPAPGDNDTSIATTAFVQNTLGGYQPLDADLTAIAALTGTNVIYYRSAANTWAAVTIGSGLTFTGGTLDAPLFGTSAKGEVPASGGGTANFLRADGTWATPSAGGATAGMVVQAAYAEDTTWNSALQAGGIGGDVIPQQTDGSQVITCSITPQSASNKLRVTAAAQFCCNANNSNFWAAVFRDAGANAVTSQFLGVPQADVAVTCSIVFEVTAGSTAATTFKLRGGTFAGSIRISWNGNTSQRRLGGSSRVTLSILEIQG